MYCLIEEVSKPFAISFANDQHILSYQIGRKMNDRMTSDNNASSRYFTSIAYSADGTCLLAGGNSKYVCIYEISQQILLKKFQISFNRSLDGILDEVSLYAFIYALI